MHTFGRAVLRNSLFTAGSQIAIKILSFAFSVFVIRQLGPSDFGQYGAILAIGSVFMIFSDLGLSPYTVREIARMRDEPDGERRINELYGNVLVLRTILTAITAIMQIGTAWLTGESALIIGAVALNTVGLLLYSLQGTSDAVLAGYERLDVAARARVIQQIIFVVLGTLVLFLNFGYYGLIIANLLAIATLLWICIRGVSGLGVRPARATPQTWLKLLRACFPFGVIGLTLGLSYGFDRILIYHFHGDTANGLYTAAYNLVFSTVVVSNVINTALYPSLTRQATSDPVSLGRIYDRILRYLLLASLPIAIGGGLLADQIILLIGGEQYQGAIEIFRILILVSPLMFISEYFGYIILVEGRESIAARSVIISTTVNVVANIILIPTYGLIAAAIITVVTEMVLVIQYIIVLRSRILFDRMHTITLPIIAATAMGICVWLIRAHIPIAANIAAGALIYTILLLMMNVVGRDEINFLRNLRRTNAEAKS